MVELITAIFLLGIIASVAIPRFLGVSREAKIATLEGMGSAMRVAASQVYIQAVMQGKSSLATSSVDLDGDGTGDIDIRFGYPDSTRETGITQALDQSVQTQWSWSSNASRSRFFMTSTAISIGGIPGNYINDTRVTPTNCYLTYFRPTATGPNPRIEFTTSCC